MIRDMINVGIVVRLRSGGPKMTVTAKESAGPWSGRTVCYCAWFEENELGHQVVRRASFPTEALGRLQDDDC